MASLPQNWKNWVVQQLLSGCDAKETLNIILENGFPFEAAKKALGNNLPANTCYFKDGDFYRRLANPGLLNKLQQYDAEYLEQDKAQLIKINQFISPDFCQQIIDLAKSELRPSEITNPDEYQGFRTSSTCDLKYLEHPVADKIDQLIIDCLDVGVGEKEVIQAQHYAIGQQFKAHTDYFDPGTDSYREFSKDGGQRTWTFMIYLNQECEGGETEFPHLGLSFKPTTGTAIVWNNLHDDGSVNFATLHQAHPIKSGEKVVITKWFREQDPAV